MATYLDNAGVTQILTKIKSLLAKKAEITAIPTKVSQLTNDSYYQNATEVSTKIDNKIGTLNANSALASDPGDNYIATIAQEDGVIDAYYYSFTSKFESEVEAAREKGSIAGRTEVNNAINNALKGITSFEYNVVSELPPESDGRKGTIYLLRHGGNDNTNVFDEYILVDPYTGTDGIAYSAHYEKIGTTDIDLTPYAKKTEIPTSVSQLLNDEDYIDSRSSADQVATAVNGLKYTDSAETGKYVSSVSQTNGVIKVTRANLPAVGTADSPISNTTIESIFTQVFG